MTSRDKQSCAICGARNACEHGQQVCARCREHPEDALRRHERALEAAIREQHAAAREAEAAWAALTPTERERWSAMALVRERRACGESLDPASERRLERTLQAYVSDDPRISAALRDYFHADEKLYWTSGAVEGRRAEYERALVLLHRAQQPTLRVVRRQERTTYVADL